MTKDGFVKVKAHQIFFNTRNTGMKPLILGGKGKYIHM